MSLRRTTATPGLECSLCPWWTSATSGGSSRWSWVPIRRGAGAARRWGANQGKSDRAMESGPMKSSLQCRTSEGGVLSDEQEEAQDEGRILGGQVRRESGKQRRDSRLVAGSRAICLGRAIGRVDRQAAGTGPTARRGDPY